MSAMDTFTLANKIGELLEQQTDESSRSCDSRKAAVMQQRESTVFLQPVMEFAEIAEAMGVSKQRVHQLYQSALRKLRTRTMAPARAMLADLHSERSYARTRRNRPVEVARCA